MKLRECEDCEEECKRRRYRCVHCGLLVCGYCIGHMGHACGPGHAEKDCRDRKAVANVRAKHGQRGVRQLYARLRARALRERRAA